MQLLSQLPYTQREARRKLVSTLSLKDVTDYRDTLFRDATPEMLVVGNLSADSVTQLGMSLNSRCRVMRSATGTASMSRLKNR